jgi:hypothetical protein
MAVIQTRYRDIPWSEIQKAHSPRAYDSPEWWEKLRGQPVSIELPPRGPIGDRCSEPHYRVSTGHPFLEGKSCFVCPHLAEIGD